MKMLKGIALGMLLAVACTPAWAEEAKEQKASAPIVEKYDFVYEMGKNMPTDVFAGEITAKEMENRLNSDDIDDRLYLKYSDDKVLSFTDLGEDRASCRQILYASPKNTILQFYTNDKKSAKQMLKTLKDYGGEWKLVDGYRVVSDKRPDVKLANGKVIYRFWFKKVKPDNRAVRIVGDYYPYPYYGYPVDFYWHPWYYRHGWYGPRHHRPHPGPGPRPGPRPCPRPRR